MNVNLEKSRELIEQTNARNGFCFLNAIRAIAHVDGPAFYVEGWSVLFGKDGIGIGEHGWIELGGEIIEVTPGWPDWEGETIRHFPVVRYSKEFAVGAAIAGVSLPLVRGLGRPPREYWQARRAARRHYISLFCFTVFTLIRSQPTKIKRDIHVFLYKAKARYLPRDWG